MPAQPEFTPTKGEEGMEGQQFSPSILSQGRGTESQQPTEPGRMEQLHRDPELRVQDQNPKFLF